MIATEQRWEDVNQAWDEALERSELRSKSEVQLDGPSQLERPILCWELELKD